MAIQVCLDRQTALIKSEFASILLSADFVHPRPAACTPRSLLHPLSLLPEKQNLCLCFSSSPLQNLLQLLLLLRREVSWEIDLISNDKITSPTLLHRHSEVWIYILRARLRWAGFLDADVLVIDGLHGTFPAGQRFLQVELDFADDVVIVASEDGMFFLLCVSI
jgi:hypothetical protein